MLVGRTSIVLYFAVILFVLRCCTLVLVGTTSIVLRCAAILVDRTSVVLLCWWSQRALGDDDKRRRFRDQVHSHRAANQRDAGSVLHSVWSQVICVEKIANEVFLLRW